MGAGLNLNMGVVRGNGVEHTDTLPEYVESRDVESRGGEFGESREGESRGGEFGESRGESRGGEFGESRDGESRGGEFGESRNGKNVGHDIICVSGAVSSFTLLPVSVCNKAP